MRSAFTKAAFILCAAASAENPTPWFRYLTYYGNGTGEVRAGVANIATKGSLADKLAIFQDFQVPSLYGPLDSLFDADRNLKPGWGVVLEGLARDEILPNYGNQSALRGVFLGDEICCHNTTCWNGTLAPLASKVRALLGQRAVIYTNECANDNFPLVPRDIDLISVDVYDGYTPGSNGTAEVLRAKKYFEENVFPSLDAHQRALVVPGTFACSNESYFPLADADANVAQKLRGFAEWIKKEPRIVGMNPWHLNNRPTAQHPPPCDMRVGLLSLPRALAVAREIASYVGPF